LSAYIDSLYVRLYSPTLPPYTTRLLNMSKASTTLHRSQFYFAIVVTIFITMLSEPDVTEKCIC
jgi:hypothetical protein